MPDRTGTTCTIRWMYVNVNLSKLKQERRHTNLAGTTLLALVADRVGIRIRQTAHLSALGLACNQHAIATGGHLLVNPRLGVLARQARARTNVS